MYKKKFGGKEYTLQYRSMKKKNIERNKEELRPHGFNMRVTTGPKSHGHKGFKYALWVRKKSKKS